MANTTPARRAPVRSIPDIAAGDRRRLSDALEAIKEIVEVREGMRGNPGDRFVTYNELMEILANL
jgi:hypothetical protein